ncbi:P-loop containing nucleoside triphosphate hydrolase protein [Mycena olivaceomarginata]|nr:P-loop containing nucleoside triphosphate hydrolase protein [Mycena olivaceomarginata]
MHSENTSWWTINYVSLEVLDTAGQGLVFLLTFVVLVRLIIAGQGFLLVYDITSLPSFKRLEVFLQAVRRIKRGEAIMVLVGKSDKESEREVTKEQAFELANRLGCEIIETSARTAVNINAAFAHVVRVTGREYETSSTAEKTRISAVPEISDGKKDTDGM